MGNKNEKQEVIVIQDLEFVKFDDKENKIMQSSMSGKQYIIYENIFHDELQFQNYKKLSQFYLNNHYQFLLNLANYKDLKGYGCCGKSQALQLLYEYYPDTIQNYIDKNFKESVIWMIILRRLQYLGYFYEIMYKIFIQIIKL